MKVPYSWIKDYGQDEAVLLRDVINHITGKEVKVYGYPADNPVCEDDSWEWVL